MRRRSFNKEYKEVDRKSRVRLYKAGKHWVTAVLSQLSLFRVAGASDRLLTSTLEENKDADRLSDASRNYLKGIMALGAVSGGGVLLTHGQTVLADEALTTSSASTGDTLVDQDTVVISSSATDSQVSESQSVVSSETTTEESTVTTATDSLLSESLSQSLSVSQSESQSLAASEAISSYQSLSQSSSLSEEFSVVSSESASALAASSLTDSSTEDAKSLLDQNVSEAELLVPIANRYAATLTDTTAKAQLQAAIATVQAEISQSSTLLAATSSAQAYETQRKRLSDALDVMLASLEAAGYTGNGTSADGSAMTYAVLAATGDSSSLSLPAYATLRGDQSTYYVKRIVQYSDLNSSYTTSIYVLDPSEISNFSSSDIGTTDTSKYTLVFSTGDVAAGSAYTYSGTMTLSSENVPTSVTTRVYSRNGDYYMDYWVIYRDGEYKPQITSWYSVATGQALTTAPDSSLSIGPGRNENNVIGGSGAARVTTITIPVQGVDSTVESMSVSFSASASTSELQSVSASQSVSQSLSISGSASQSLSTSVSQSESTSASVSASESLSTSVSVSESLSTSVSQSESLSESVSVSESLSTSVSESESLSTSVSQ
ncbi:accessory Sec-dependent serine-rich glycoprotein adhesin, partial [Streptococcus sp. DD12]|uniref:accessory Sec-dependent serine-rich glycoprotein adhesin n=1 Tax=Streptococcus sp. DD12 TaxID=1777880 RepID=UPI0018D4C735